MLQLDKIAPNVSKKKRQDNLAYMLHICTHPDHLNMSVQEFQNTPLPIINALIREHRKHLKRQSKQSKGKK